MNQITIAQARFDLRVDDASPTDAQVQDLIDRAAAVVVDYLKIDPIEDDAQVSVVILTAIRLVMVMLFQDPSGVNDPLSPAVKDLLRRSRDLTVS